MQEAKATTGRGVGRDVVAEGSGAVPNRRSDGVYGWRGKRGGGNWRHLRTDCDRRAGNACESLRKRDEEILLTQIGRWPVRCRGGCERIFDAPHPTTQLLPEAGLLCTQSGASPQLNRSGTRIYPALCAAAASNSAS